MERKTVELAEKFLTTPFKSMLDAVRHKSEAAPAITPAPVAPVIPITNGPAPAPVKAPPIVVAADVYTPHHGVTPPEGE